MLWLPARSVVKLPSGLWYPTGPGKRETHSRSQIHLSEQSLALIGNCLGGDGEAQLYLDGRGIFDKETRRKALAFATEAAYGHSKPIERGSRSAEETDRDRERLDARELRVGSDPGMGLERVIFAALER